MTLNHMELENLRHLISSHQNSMKKLNFYASEVQDSQCKQMFQQSAKSAQQTADKLMSFLG
jgi:hypothetical protein